MAQHHFEQRRHVGLGIVRRFRHPALLGGAVEDREIELVVGRVERGEEIEALVDDFARTGVRLVDLVDADDGLEADLERLADHELGLRHRAFGGVHQHDRAVDHREDALDLAAEIGVAGGVDDVHAGVFPKHRGRLGENGDAAFLFEIVRVHDALGDPLVVAEGAGLLEQTVDQRGLAVVDVGDDGDVAQFHGANQLSADAGKGQRTARSPSRTDMTGTRQSAANSPRARICAAQYTKPGQKGRAGFSPPPVRAGADRTAAASPAARGGRCRGSARRPG